MTRKNLVCYTSTKEKNSKYRFVGKYLKKSMLLLNLFKKYLKKQSNKLKTTFLPPFEA